MKRQKSKKQEGGYVVVIVLTILLMLTSLGMGAVLMAGNDVKISGAETQKTATRFCAQHGMTSLLTEFYNAASMNQDYVDLSFTGGTLTLPIDANGLTSEYTYWFGHYGQSDNPYTRVYAVSSELSTALESITNSGVNLTNQMSSINGSNSVTRYYSLVVTCRAPNGTEVEMQSLVKRGI